MPLPARILFFVTFITLSGLIVVYLYRRLVSDLTTRRWVRLAGAAGMIAMAGGAMAARTLFRGSTAQGLSAFLGLWIGLVLYTLLTLLCIDLARAALKVKNRGKAPASPDRRLFLARALAGGAAVAGGGLAGVGVFRAYAPARVQEVLIKLPGLPKALDGFTIVQLSDLHIGPILQEAFVDDLVARANGAKPDLVAITGDLVDGRPAEIGRFVARLGGLQSKYGTHFCSGNHDHYAGWEVWSKELTGFGFNVLKNRWVKIGDEAASFDLIGVDDYGSRLTGRNGYDPDAAVLGRDPSRPSVLLSHQPSGFDDASRLGLGLQLSGHTHGGQTFPATGIASLIWGARAAGWSREGGSQLYVSRGCGFVGPPMRLGSPSEIIKLVLSPG